MIDSYCHCGLSKYLPVGDVRAIMQRAGVGRAVLVQHLGEYDNGYLASVVAAEPSRFVAVGLVDGSSPGWAADVAALAAAPEFAGIRVTEHVLAANPALPQAALEAGLVVVFDAEDERLPRSLAALERLLDAVPAGRVVIAHLGYPLLSDGAVVSGDELFELARYPGVHVLLSGFLELCSYPYDPLEPFARATLAAFGPERIVWGTDFPVGGGVEGYLRDLALIQAGCFGLDGAARVAVTETTPARLWFGEP